MRLGQKHSDDTSRKPQKNPEEHLRNCRPRFPQIRSAIMHPPLETMVGKNRIHGRATRRKPLLAKRNIKARLTFAKKYLDDPLKPFGKLSCGLMGRKWNFLEDRVLVTSGVKL